MALKNSGYCCLQSERVVAACAVVIMRGGQQVLSLT